MVYTFDFTLEGTKRPVHNAYRVTQPEDLVLSPVWPWLEFIVHSGHSYYVYQIR